jgi:type I restriction enzyme S subunit
MVDQFVTSSKGVGDIQRDLYWPWLKNIKVPVPPLAEQERIATQLDEELLYVNKQLSSLDREAALLNEYLTRRLISLVTGEVEIQGADDASSIRDANTTIMHEADARTEQPVLKPD